MNNKKIKILHVIHGLPIGGAEMLLLQYIKALGKKEYQHYVFSFGPDGPVKKMLQKMDVSVFLVKDRDAISHPFRFTYELISLIKKLIRYIKSNEIDLIQSHTGHSNELSMLVGILCRIPTFPTIHSTKPFIKNENSPNFGKTLLRIIDYILYKRADKIIAVSNKIATLIKTKYKLSDSKVIVLKNGICLNKNILKFQNKSDLKSPLKNSFKLIAVGRLVPLKSFDTLIKAANHLKNNAEIKLLITIIGDGPDREKLSSLIEKFKLKENVKLHGQSLNVYPFLQESDAFVIPSKYEGLSMAMIEAMACGLPVIASNGPGLRDNIQNNINGLLFSVEDSVALSKTILLLATNHELQKKLSKNSFSHFEENFNMEKNIKILKNVFQNYYKLRIKKR